MMSKKIAVPAAADVEIVAPKSQAARTEAEQQEQVRRLRAQIAAYI
jgi:hypothetical protein